MLPLYIVRRSTAAFRMPYPHPHHAHALDATALRADGRLFSTLDTHVKGTVEDKAAVELIAASDRLFCFFGTTGYRIGTHQLVFLLRSRYRFQWELF